MNKNSTENDKVVYLGLPMYLPRFISEETVYVAVSDESVAKVDGNDLVPLKQGTFFVSEFDSEKKLIKETKFVCTTFNDSKENKESLRTIISTNLADFVNVRECAYWRASVNTIMDMSYMLQARHFCYSFEGEAEFAGLEYSNINDCWMWVHSPETIFENSKGVCLQVAQLATYMLADNYEDWGVIMVDGEQGHVFNWFFEDGYYYIFDFTQVISDNAWERQGSRYFTYIDYSNKVKKFETIEEIREWCMTEKVDTKLNYHIYMLSCCGYDRMPASLNSGKSSSVECLAGTYNNGKITMAWQDIVLDSLEVLYHKEGSVDIEYKSVSADELSNLIPSFGIYSDTTLMEYRFKY